MNPAPNPPDLDSYSGRFAARLRELRKKTGMTGEQTAKAISEAGYEVKVTTYYNWESGRSEPPLNAFPPIGKAFGLNSVRTLLPQK